MDSKLSDVNRNLARTVFVVAALFAVAVTLLASLTGETMLLLGTAFGLAAGGYAMQVTQRQTVETIETRRDRRVLAA